MIIIEDETSEIDALKTDQTKAWFPTKSHSINI